MTKCPYCAGTDVQHEIGEPCLFLQMEEERQAYEEEMQRAYDEERERDDEFQAEEERLRSMGHRP